MKTTVFILLFISITADPVSKSKSRNSTIFFEEKNYVFINPIQFTIEKFVDLRPIYAAIAANDHLIQQVMDHCHLLDLKDDEHDYILLKYEVTFQEAPQICHDRGYKIVEPRNLKQIQHLTEVMKANKLYIVHSNIVYDGLDLRFRSDRTNLADYEEVNRFCDAPEFPEPHSARYFKNLYGRTDGTQTPIVSYFLTRDKQSVVPCTTSNKTAIPHLHLICEKPSMSARENIPSHIPGRIHIKNTCIAMEDEFNQDFEETQSTMQEFYTLLRPYFKGTPPSANKTDYQKPTHYSYDRAYIGYYHKLYNHRNSTLPSSKFYGIHKHRPGIRTNAHHFNFEPKTRQKRSPFLPFIGEMMETIIGVTSTGRTDTIAKAVARNSVILKSLDISRMNKVVSTQNIAINSVSDRSNLNTFNIEFLSFTLEAKAAYGANRNLYTSGFSTVHDIIFEANQMKTSNQLISQEDMDLVKKTLNTPLRQIHFDHKSTSQIAAWNTTGITMHISAYSTNPSPSPMYHIISAPLISPKGAATALLPFSYVVINTLQNKYTPLSKLEYFACKDSKFCNTVNPTYAFRHDKCVMRAFRHLPYACPLDFTAGKIPWFMTSGNTTYFSVRKPTRLTIHCAHHDRHKIADALDLTGIGIIHIQHGCTAVADGYDIYIPGTARDSKIALILPPKSFRLPHRSNLQYRQQANIMSHHLPTADTFEKFSIYDDDVLDELASYAAPSYFWPLVGTVTAIIVAALLVAAVFIYVRCRNTTTIVNQQPPPQFSAQYVAAPTAEPPIVKKSPMVRLKMRTPKFGRKINPSAPPPKYSNTDEDDEY